jgi:hypothetical protein
MAGLRTTQGRALFARVHPVRDRPNLDILTGRPLPTYGIDPLIRHQGFPVVSVEVTFWRCRASIGCDHGGTDRF